MCQRPRTHGSGHRLGPLIVMVPLERPIIGRLYAIGLATAVGAIVAVAAGLIPAGRDMGTHQQLGLPPCGFVLVTGLPCPTCGMTTAFAYTVRGQVVQAIRSQLAGFLIAAATVGAGLAGLVAVATGRRPSLNWYRVNPVHLVWWSFGLLIAAWALKIVLWLLAGGRSMGTGA